MGFLCPSKRIQPQGVRGQPYPPGGGFMQDCANDVKCLDLLARIELDGCTAVRDALDDTATLQFFQGSSDDMAFRIVAMDELVFVKPLPRQQEAEDNPRFKRVDDLGNRVPRQISMTQDFIAQNYR